MKPVTFIDRLKTKIENAKNKDHKYIVVGSGTINKINKDLLSTIPVEDRTDMQRRLISDWQSNNQTLCGLRAVVKDQTLLYSYTNIEYISDQIKAEMTFDIKNIIVPRVAQPEISSFAKSVNVIALEECLFIG